MGAVTAVSSTKSSCAGGADASTSEAKSADAGAVAETPSAKSASTGSNVPSIGADESSAIGVGATAFSFRPKSRAKNPFFGSSNMGGTSYSAFGADHTASIS